jgi:hypothetical protein
LRQRGGASARLRLAEQRQGKPPVVIARRLARLGAGRRVALNQINQLFKSSI